MPDAKFEKSLQPPLLDRLIDLDPETRNEPPVSRAESLRRFRQAVKRDLEWLLNTTRIPMDEIPPAYKELRKSLFCYGLPDISNLSLTNSSDEQRLLRTLEVAIETFEPRLTRARVTSSEPIEKSRQAITFHVEAVLMIDPAPERIAFDTVLEISKGAYSVQET
jgi:type VI secretion system protein ImpF